MRLTGACLLTAAGLLMGLLAADGLRQRVRLLESLGRLLEGMAFELERFKTPLPALFTQLAAQLEGEAALVCLRMAAGLSQPERRPFAELWGAALDTLPARERRLLLPLGTVLGRYGAEEQLRALTGVQAAVERAGDEARRALEKKGRVYVGVSAAGAAALAVLLL